MPQTSPIFRLFSLATLAGIAIPLQSMAQQDEPERNASESLREYISPPRLEGRTNAAFEYLRVWDTLSGPDNRYFRSHEIWFPRGSDEAKEAESWVAGAGGTGKEPEFLAHHADLIESLIRAAAIPDCGWGLPATPDIDNLLFFAPVYMELMRNSAWAVAADADRCINEGKPGPAVDRIVALIQMSCQNHEDHYLILSNVSSQWCRAALDLTTIMLNKGQVTPALARPILTALKGVSKEDPFGIITCVESEQRRMLHVLHTRYTGADAGARFMNDVNRTGFTDDTYGFICALHEDQFQAQLRGVEACYARAAALWRQPDSDAQRGELHDEVREGQYGLLALVVPGSSRIYYRIVMEVRTGIDQTSKTLTEIVGLNQTPVPEPAAPAGR